MSTSLYRCWLCRKGFHSPVHRMNHLVIDHNAPVPQPPAPSYGPVVQHGPNDWKEAGHGLWVGLDRERHPWVAYLIEVLQP